MIIVIDFACVTPSFNMSLNIFFFFILWFVGEANRTEKRLLTSRVVGHQHQSALRKKVIKSVWIFISVQILSVYYCIAVF